MQKDPMTDKQEELMPDEIWLQPCEGEFNRYRKCNGNIESPTGNLNGAIRYVRADHPLPKEREEALGAFELMRQTVHDCWTLMPDIYKIETERAYKARDAMRAHQDTICAALARPNDVDLEEEWQHPITYLISYAETCCEYLESANYLGKAQSLKQRCKEARNHLNANGYLGVPEGFALLPIEPTEEMVKAGVKAFNSTPTDDMQNSKAIDNEYKAMIKAAQTEKG